MVNVLWLPVAFIVGCVVWNYLGDKIKVWLHLKEASIGQTIKADISNVETKIKSKL